MNRVIFLLSLIFFFGSVLPAYAADTTRPIIGLTTPASATAGVSQTFSAQVSDADSGIASCYLYVNNEDVGQMAVDGNTASKAYTFAQAGIHTMFVFCRDHGNNFQSGENASVTVSPGSGDSIPPSVSSLTPTTAVVGTAVTLSTSVSDSGTGVAACELIVNGFSQGAMAIFSGTASRSHTFTVSDTTTVYAQCADGVGNSTSGPNTTIAVLNQTPGTSGSGGSSSSGSSGGSASSSNQTPSTGTPQILPANPTPRLIKLTCAADSPTDHPCRAVYYHGLDNKRHAFSNAKVYATWYQGYSNVQEYSLEVMSSVALGAPVTYRPGIRMVKFTTENKVYAVAKGGVLRWITGEDLARAYYGQQWSLNVDDVSDAFYAHYTFGPDIQKESDYSPTGEIAGTTTIDKNF